LRSRRDAIPRDLLAHAVTQVHHNITGFIGLPKHTVERSSYDGTPLQRSIGDCSFRIQVERPMRCPYVWPQEPPNRRNYNAEHRISPDNQHIWNIPAKGAESPCGDHPCRVQEPTNITSLPKPRPPNSADM